MRDPSDDQASRRFLAGLHVGDICSGTATEVTPRGVLVTLDGFAARPLGVVGSLDLTWGRRHSAGVEVGRRITAEVLAVDADDGTAWLSTAATQHPELWAFLRSLRLGETLSGTVAAIENFGVFVALDDGPDHPAFPGVGFISIPELSWTRFETIAEVVQVGQRVSCEFLQFDTTNGEARLSLRAERPDPFRAFADGTEMGRTLRGRVTKLAPIGVFVRVADGIEGLVPSPELSSTPEGDASVAAPEVGDEVTVTVAGIDRVRRTVLLSRRQGSPDLG
ncbi:S1 RNA-binding domain-containing protein [Streptomyces sp. NBC_00467]|uniref:S1 RNA-binding domain-containing protein n=1 Tax=Streptomyces sp. NBC_00467 TaxID=2975752 RepID=UPI002E19E942